MFGFCLSTSSASPSNPGAKTSSTNIEFSRSASARSIGRLKHMTPPKALSGSVASAFSNASSTVEPTPQPHGLLCLMITAAGSSNSSIRRRPESRSSRLLKDSSLPWIFDTRESRWVRARASA